MPVEALHRQTVDPAPSLSPCSRSCLVQVSYSIAVAEPLSVFVDTYGTGKKADADILAMIRKAFDFRPGEPTGAGRRGPAHVDIAPGHVDMSGGLLPHLPRMFPATDRIHCSTLFPCPPYDCAHTLVACPACADHLGTLVVQVLKPSYPRRPARPHCQAPGPEAWRQQALPEDGRLRPLRPRRRRLHLGAGQAPGVSSRAGSGSRALPQGPLAPTTEQ